MWPSRDGIQRGCASAASMGAQPAETPSVSSPLGADWRCTRDAHLCPCHTSACQQDWTSHTQTAAVTQS